MLRDTPTGQEFKGQISLAQHDNTGPFCHSEEQGDEESRVMQKSLRDGLKLYFGRPGGGLWGLRFQCAYSGASGLKAS